VPSNEHGAAAVELAIVLFPLLLLVLGVVEFGRVYSQQLTMQYAAREAAREIALEYDDPGMTDLLLLGGAEQTLVNLIPAFDDPSDLGSLSVYQLVTCQVGGPAGQRAIVRLEDQTPLRIPMIDGSSFGTVPIAATAEMPCEG
jgi:TadE-like protein